MFIVFIFFVFVWGGMLLQQLVPIKSHLECEIYAPNPGHSSSKPWSLASFGACAGFGCTWMSQEVRING